MYQKNGCKTIRVLICAIIACQMVAFAGLAGTPLYQGNFNITNWPDKGNTLPIEVESLEIDVTLVDMGDSISIISSGRWMPGKTVNLGPEKITICSPRGQVLEADGTCGETIISISGNSSIIATISSDELYMSSIEIPLPEHWRSTSGFSRQISLPWNKVFSVGVDENLAATYLSAPRAKDLFADGINITAIIINRLTFELLDGRS